MRDEEDQGSMREQDTYLQTTMNDTVDDEEQLLCNSEKDEQEGIEMQSLSTKDQTDPQTQCTAESENDQAEQQEPEKDKEVSRSVKIVKIQSDIFISQANHIFFR